MAAPCQIRAMRRALLLLSLVLAGCGPPVAVGTWQLSEVMDHRCRASGDLGMACDGEAAFDPASHRGTIVVEQLEWNRLRLVDVDGRTTIGRSYNFEDGSGARFRWLEKRTAGDTGCVTSSDEVIELVDQEATGEKLTGQRRIYSSYSAECGTASVTDVGYTVSAERAAEAP